MLRRAAGSRAAVVAVTAVCATLLGACGAGRSDRDEVGAFIRSLNQIQDDAAPALAQADRVYTRMARGKLPATRAPAATRATEQTILSLRGRVQALPAPSSAENLKRRVLAAFDADAAMAEQTVLLARYVPAQQRSLRTVRALGAHLQARLRARAGHAAAQAGALTDYAVGLNEETDRLRVLKPPLALVSVRDAQLVRLRGSRGIALQLRAAVLSNDATGVGRLLSAFRRVNARAPDPRLARAGYRAYKEYRVRIDRARFLVNAEVARLDRRLRG